MPSEQYRPTNKTIVVELKSFTVDAVRKVMAFRTTTAEKVGLDTPITTQDINVGDDDFEISNVSKLVGISSIKPFVVELKQTNEIITYPPLTYDVSFDGSSVTIHENQNLYVSITDQDLDTPTKNVQVSNNDTGELETLTLNRVGTTSTYTGSISTTAVGTAGVDEDGDLNAVIGQLIIVAYSDNTDSDGDPENATYFINVTPEPTHTGVLKIEDSFTPGDPIPISLYDPDEAGSGSIQVQLNNQTNGQVENPVTIPEVSPGLFKEFFSTFDSSTAAANNSGFMNLTAGDVISCVYEDAANDSGLPETIQQVITVGANTTYTGIVSHSGTEKSGQPLTIKVEDPDRDTSVQVTVVNQTTNETETLTLLETSPLSGVFELELPTVLGEDTWYAGTNEDGSINVKENDIVRVTYNDPVSVTGLPFSVVHDITMLASDPEPAAPDPIITEETQTVTMNVTGLFFITGEMPNTTLTIKKTSTEQDDFIRCSLMVV